jgi:CrcB protein
MSSVFLVFVGGGIGASLRYLSGLAAVRLLGPSFPWGTLFVNVLGSFAMGALAGWLTQKSLADGQLRLLLATGLLGGFTTFSAFSLDAVVLWERGAHQSAALYVLASLVCSLAALAAGLWLVRSL